MVGEDTHLASLGRDVDLDDVLGLVDRLRNEIAEISLVRFPEQSDFFNSWPIASLAETSINRVKKGVPGEGATSSA